MITICCDHVDEQFRICPVALSGLAFNAKPANWQVIETGHGDHMDFCPDHHRPAPIKDGNEYRAIHPNS